ncbi:MAG TPA: HNH endonuclease [Saprospiraceae bacterium]|nr:HNH endonuclease [Saprospiraceae bacterium]
MFSNACPEVSLFDNGTIFGFIPEKAIVGGTWDNLWEENKFGDDNKFNIYNVGHYCECPEFGQYHYENKIVRAKRKTSRRRAPISTKLRFEIFQRDNFTCQYCKRNKDEDGVKLEIDHIVPVEMGGKDEISNLTTSCRECNNGKSNKVI